jgi:hypothetical protein
MIDTWKYDAHFSVSSWWLRKKNNLNTSLDSWSFHEPGHLPRGSDVGAHSWQLKKES